jgi:hypothetical protein
MNLPGDGICSKWSSAFMDLHQQSGVGSSGMLQSPYGSLMTSCSGYTGSAQSSRDMGPYGPGRGSGGGLGGPYSYHHGLAGGLGGGGAYGLPSPPGTSFGLDPYQSKSGLLSSTSRDGTSLRYICPIV